MKKYICDRCGKDTKRLNIITLTPMSYRRYVDIDLCLECYTKFCDFVNELGRCNIDLSEALITEEEDEEDNRLHLEDES